jgi:hypothetical protein
MTNSKSIKPCKRCGSQPVLHRPSKYDKEFQNMRMNAILTDYEPEPYYRCENCRMMAEVEKNNRIIEDWNKKNDK